MPTFTYQSDTNTFTITGSTLVNLSGSLSSTDQTRVNNLPVNTITELSLKAPLASPAFTGTVSGISKSMVGLGNVDNTSDLSKPVSTATTTAINNAVSGLTKSSVGLGNVDNTADADKPVSSATATAISNKADLVGGKVPSSQLPDLSTGALVYQGLWNASTNTPSISDGTGTNLYYYKVSVAGSQDLGSGSISFSIGDWVIHNGSIWEKLDQSETVSSVAGRTGNITLTKSDVSLGNVDNTSDANKPVSTATQTAINTHANDITTNPHQITTTLLGIPNVENKSASQIIGEIVESDIPSAIARISQLPVSLDDLTESASARKVTDAEKAIWNSNSGTITGGTITAASAITFTTPYVKINTTSSISFTSLAGISQYNPAILEVTTTGSIDFDSCTGVTYADTLTKMGNVYMVLIINSGTAASPSYYIFNKPQSGGEALNVSQVITSAQLLSSFTTGIQLSAASGAGIIDDFYSALAYVKFNTTAYATNTILELISGSTTIATCDCLGATVSGWYKFTFSGSPEENGALTLKTQTGNPTAGDSQIGAIAYYRQAQQSNFTFGSYNTVPDAPTSLTATLNGNDVDLTWDAPVNDGGSSVTLYHIYRDTDGGGYSEIDTSATTTYTDTAPGAGTHTYRVTAENSVGEGSASNTDSVIISASNPWVTINFGSTAGETNINDWANPLTGSVSNLVNENGTNTGHSIAKVAGSGSVVSVGAQTGDDSGIVPDSVLLSAIQTFNSDSGLFYELTLGASTTYEIQYIGSRSTTTDITEYNRLTVANAVLETVALTTVSGNTSTYATMNHTTDSNGKTRFEVQRQTGSVYGYLNALRYRAV